MYVPPASSSAFCVIAVPMHAAQVGDSSVESAMRIGLRSHVTHGSTMIMGLLEPLLQILISHSSKVPSRGARVMAESDIPLNKMMHVMSMRFPYDCMSRLSNAPVELRAGKPAEIDPDAVGSGPEL